MFSVDQKRMISEKIQKVLRDTGHPDLPDTEIQFHMHVGGPEDRSSAVIENNGTTSKPSVNPHNEAMSSREKVQVTNKSTFCRGCKIELTEIELAFGIFYTLCTTCKENIKRHHGTVQVEKVENVRLCKECLKWVPVTKIKATMTICNDCESKKYYENMTPSKSSNGDLPASPIKVSHEQFEFSDTTHLGMTKREAFAMAAMPSIQLGSIDVLRDHVCKILGIDIKDFNELTSYPEYVAKLAVIQADALLKELEK